MTFNCATCNDTGKVTVDPCSIAASLDIDATRDCPDCTPEALFARIETLEAEATRDNAEINGWIAKCNTELKLRKEAEERIEQLQTALDESCQRRGDQKVREVMQRMDLMNFPDDHPLFHGG